MAMEQKRAIPPSITRRRFGPVVLWFGLAVLALPVAGTVQAASGRINLGRPTNDLPSPNLPVGGFHHVPLNLKQDVRPLVLLLGTALDFDTAVIRWPLVKALDQFGQFANARPAPQACDYSHLPPPIPRGHFGFTTTEPCGPPTIDLSHAVYRSRYVAFHEWSVLDQKHVVRVSRLPAAVRMVYNRYARTHVSTNETEDIAASVNGIPTAPSSRRLPLVLIGHYLQTIEQNVFPADFAVTFAPGSVTRSENPIPYLSFARAQSALRSDRAPASGQKVQYSGFLLHDVNADANLFIAVICRADGSSPRSVCARPAIRSILRHLK